MNRGCHPSSLFAFAFETRIEVSMANEATYGAISRISQRGTRRGGETWKLSAIAVKTSCQEAG